jgi:UDP-N-acetylglucosamine transferase subunit ALG13
LIDHNILSDKVFAQTGFSDYQPRNYEYKNFLDRDEFKQKIKESEIVITHGGTGSIMGAVKAGKWVIAVPRLRRYGEHVDDHQEQIIKQLMEEKIIIGVNRLEDIDAAIEKCGTFPVKKYESNTEAIIENIKNYILEISNKSK